ncbi:MAG: signal peptidase I, partial [Proteobacteria bacterium]|nr:signal peptidase I [Pseudomonadota bacterium]
MMSLGYALFRHSAPEEKRKIIKFWLEIFSLCSVLLVVRLFYTVFPSVPPDKFFFGCTLLAGAFYLYYKITRHNATDEKKKVIKLCRDAFLCLLLVFVFRGFFYDWFRIPSNSMQPTLAVGDLVLTDKNRYGYRLPLFNTRLTPGTPPARGDIIIFKKPGEELFYI